MMAVYGDADTGAPSEYTPARPLRDETQLEVERAKNAELKRELAARVDECANLKTELHETNNALYHARRELLTRAQRTTSLDEHDAQSLQAVRASLRIVTLAVRACTERVEQIGLRSH